jgi:hypothetical protein
MKRVSLGLVLLLVACAGARARQHVLLPAMRTAWVSIAPEARVGGATEEQVSAMDAALETGFVEVGGWPTLRDLALVGIQMRLENGEIGIGVAALLRERVRQFDVSYGVITNAR